MVLSVGCSSEVHMAPSTHTTPHAPAGKTSRDALLGCFASLASPHCARRGESTNQIRDRVCGCHAMYFNICLMADGLTIVMIGMRRWSRQSAFWSQITTLAVLKPTTVWVSFPDTAYIMGFFSP